MAQYSDKAAATMARYRQTAAGASDAAAVKSPELFDLWDSKKSYAVGDRVRYGDLLYKCLTNHAAQDDWRPDVAPSLWVRVDDPAIEYPEWRQSLGGHDAYPKGAKVSHADKRWVSNVAANTWEPGVYGWDEQN